MGSLPRLVAHWFARFFRAHFSVIACLSGAFLLAAPAHAERDPSANNGHWAVVNAGSCSLILNAGALYLSPDARYSEDTDWPAKITWNGPCGAGGLANGRGTMTIAVYFKENNFSTDYRSTYKGEMRNGVMTGVFEQQTTNNDGTGTYTSNYPAENYTYTNGCDTEWDFGNECQFADAQALQGRFGVGSGAGGAPAYAGGATYTTVGGQAVAPPTFAAPQENALATVTDGLVSALGGRSGLSFSTGDATVDTILASLRTTLGLNDSAALGGKGGMLNLVLSEVRKALGGANPASTNGQIADLVMDTVRIAVASGGKPAVAAAVAPAPISAPISAPPPRAVASNTRASSSGSIAAPKMVTAANIQSVIDYIASKGDSVSQTTDSEGKPQLKEADNRYLVFFYDCDDAGTQCDTLQFNACYADYPKGNVTKTNEWSAGYVKIKAYIDDNGWVCLDQVVPTGKAGVSYEAMDLSFDAFLWFREHADEQFK